MRGGRHARRSTIHFTKLGPITTAVQISAKQIGPVDRRLVNVFFRSVGCKTSNKLCTRLIRGHSFRCSTGSNTESGG